MKYKRGLVKDIEEQRLFEKEQKELKKKHHISEQDERIVVEKDNMTKFLSEPEEAWFGLQRISVLVLLQSSGWLLLSIRRRERNCWLCGRRF